jgi:hypothetical protein
MGIRELTRYHNRVRRQKCPEENLAMFRRWIALADQMLKDAAASAAPPPGPMPSPDPGMGAMPPGPPPPEVAGPPGGPMLPS